LNFTRIATNISYMIINEIVLLMKISIFECFDN
jgi:hypothetical protein